MIENKAPPSVHEPRGGAVWLSARLKKALFSKIRNTPPVPLNGKRRDIISGFYKKFGQTISSVAKRIRVHLLAPAPRGALRAQKSRIIQD